MPNRIAAPALFLLFVLLFPLSANAANLTELFSFYYGLFVIPVALLIHIMATIVFQKRGYYCSKAFTRKYLIVALLVPIIGIALITVEYLLDMSTTGIHIGTFLSVLFVYGLVSLIFAIPYILYLSSFNTIVKET